MGAVYKVRHRLFNEVRVIKVMRAALAGDKALQERFSAEARRGKQLKHRNIAEVLDYVIGSNGNAHLVMEYVDGINLRDEMTLRGAPLDPAAVVMIAVQTLAALSYLHQRSLIHRDISPDNVMITRDADGRPLVKLIDLGIAKSLEDSSIVTSAGNFIGKLSYASPEQFGGDVDARSDIYSLGVVLYELLTATKPITGNDTASLIMAHYRTPPRAFTDTDPSHRVPEALRAVVLKALEKKPEDRYQTADEFADALREAVPLGDATPTVFAPPPAPPQAASAAAAQTIAPTRTVAPPPPAAPTTPIAIGERTHRGDTIVVPAQARDHSGTMQRILVSAAAIAVIAFTGLATFRMMNNRDPRNDPPAATTAAPVRDAASQPAGESIPVEAPLPKTTTHPAIPAPVLVENSVSTTTVASASPLPTNPPVVAPQPSSGDAIVPVRITARPTVTSPPRDLAEGDRARRLALAYSNGHQWQSAVSAWRDFIRDYGGANPAADHAAYYNLGVAHEALQQWNEAASSFERATVADAKVTDTNNLLRLGHVYGKLGRWTDSAATYERVLRIDPANALAKRGLLYAVQQEPRKR